MPSVLITGASRGIGRVTALRLADSGWDVIGGVRRPEDGEALQAERPDRIRWVRLDVTDAVDVAGLDAALPDQLDAVVNNAGVVVAGPVEAVPLDDLRWQLEVNVVGQAAVTQAVLPRLRASTGRIVFVSSVSGRVATPGTGAYNASKFALEGMVDALRMEVRPWGVRAILVEPAQTATDMWHSATDELDAAEAKMTDEHRRLYAKQLDFARNRMIPMSQKLAVPAEDVAADIERALTDRRPKARYVVGTGPRIQAALSSLLPTPVLDAVLRAAGGVPRRP